MPLLDWLAQNYGTILICAILAAGFALLLVGLIRDKKSGKSCCGGCAGCAMSGHCHAAPAAPPADTPDKDTDA